VGSANDASSVPPEKRPFPAVAGVLSLLLLAGLTAVFFNQGHSPAAATAAAPSQHAGAIAEAIEAKRQAKAHAATGGTSVATPASPAAQPTADQPPAVQASTKPSTKNEFLFLPPDHTPPASHGQSVGLLVTVSADNLEAQEQIDSILHSTATTVDVVLVLVDSQDQSISVSENKELLENFARSLQQFYMPIVVAVEQVNLDSDMGTFVSTKALDCSANSVTLSSGRTVCDVGKGVAGGRPTLALAWGLARLSEMCEIIIHVSSSLELRTVDQSKDWLATSTDLLHFNPHLLAVMLRGQDPMGGSVSLRCTVAQNGECECPDDVELALEYAQQAKIQLLPLRLDAGGASTSAAAFRHCCGAYDGTFFSKAFVMRGSRYEEHLPLREVANRGFEELLEGNIRSKSFPAPFRAWKTPRDQANVAVYIDDECLGVRWTPETRSAKLASAANEVARQKDKQERQRDKQAHAARGAAITAWDQARTARLDGLVAAALTSPIAPSDLNTAIDVYKRHIHGHVLHQWWTVGTLQTMVGNVLGVYW
jgi:hypothetical protein